MTEIFRLDDQNVTRNTLVLFVSSERRFSIQLSLGSDFGTRLLLIQQLHNNLVFLLFISMQESSLTQWCGFPTNLIVLKA